MHVAFPYRRGAGGTTASTDQAGHVRDLIELVLFTSPGERVNRPDFGSGVMQLVFAPNADALASATRATVQGALVQWLGELIDVRDVTVDSDDASLHITVTYVLRRTGAAGVAELTRPL